MVHRASIWMGVLFMLALTLAVTGPSTALTSPVTIGRVEKARITVGIRQPNAGSQAPFFVGNDKGFFRDEGFESVQVVTTEQVREGVAGGSLDFGVAEVGSTVEAMLQGVPLRVIAGYRNREPYYLAVRREILSVRDLEGKNVNLGGTPGDRNYVARAGLLKDAGWDLSTIKANVVVVPGGSDAHVRLFLEGRIHLTYFFARHRPSIEAAGHRVLVFKMMEWPNDLLLASEGFLTKNPNTATRFLRGTLRAMQVWLTPSNKEYVIGLMERNGFTVTPANRQMYEEGDLALYDKDMALLQDGLMKLLKASGFNDPPRFDRISNLLYLRQAWRSLEIPERR